MTKADKPDARTLMKALEEQLAAKQIEISKLGLRWVKSSDEQRPQLLKERAELDAQYNAIVDTRRELLYLEHEQYKAARKAAEKKTEKDREEKTNALRKNPPDRGFGSHIVEHPKIPQIEVEQD